MKRLCFIVLSLVVPGLLAAQEASPTMPPGTPAALPGVVRADPPPATSFVPVADAVYQWSVRVGEDADRRAYLWIPEGCASVRGVIFGVQNMQEQELFADPAIRQAAASESLAIVWISPGDDLKTPTTKYPDLLLKFSPPPEAMKQVQQALTDLAAESGYAEIATAPLLVTAHSAATPLVWGMDWLFDPTRMVAIFPDKGWYTGHVKTSIPVFHISSEYAEVGAQNWGETYLKDRVEMQRLRAEGADRLAGEFVDIGAGHYEWNPNCAGVVALFIKKAARLRIPPTVPASGPVTLKPVDPKSGWLIDPAKLGTPEGKPVPASQWQGDPAKAFWYFDEELAKAVNDYMMAGLAKKPQVLTIMDQGKGVADYSKGGVAVLHPQFDADGATFRVEGAYLDRSPITNLYGGNPVGHATGPILFKVSSGGLQQVGPNAFRVWMHRGGLVRQGPPWEPHLMAYQSGDKDFRRADRPIHPVGVGTVNKTGAPQTITFPKIADQHGGAAGLKLQATADSKLPVQFYVISGSAQIDPADNTRLTFLKVPPRAKWPVRIVVGAYQCGRYTGAKVQNAEPVTQEFMLQK